MTRRADCRRVRARMARTGESYAAARSRLLADYLGMVPGDSRLDWMPGALHVSTGCRRSCNSALAVTRRRTDEDRLLFLDPLSSTGV
jgi:hypothetical protein